MSSDAGAARVDRARAPRGSARPRASNVEQRLGGVAGGVLDREPGDPGPAAAATLAADRVRLDREPALEVGVDRHLDRRRRSRARWAERLVERHRGCRAGPATRRTRSWSSRAPGSRAARAGGRCRRPTGWGSRSSRPRAAARNAAVRSTGAAISGGDPPSRPAPGLRGPGTVWSSGWWIGGASTGPSTTSSWT